MELATYLTKLEKNLFFGSARWVADFTESFRDYTLDGATFDMLVTGRMRGKGFLFSRLVSYLLMPNYFAACLVHAGDVDATQARRLLRIAQEYREREELRFVWLVLVQQGPFTRKVRALLDSLRQADTLAVALVDLEGEEVIVNDAYLGRRMQRHVKVF